MYVDAKHLFKNNSFALLLLILPCNKKFRIKINTIPTIRWPQMSSIMYFQNQILQFLLFTFGNDYWNGKTCPNLPHTVIISGGTYNAETLPWRASDIFAGLERDRFDTILFLRDCIRLYNYYDQRINMLCIYVFVPNIRPILRFEVITSRREDDRRRLPVHLMTFSGFHMADLPRSNFDLVLVRNTFL
jgi:hypothetical protein